MQNPDTKPGLYYVTAQDGGRTAFVAGPFRDDHARALALVDEARRVAERLDPRAVWYAFGTSRIDDAAAPACFEPNAAAVGEEALRLIADWRAEIIANLDRDEVEAEAEKMDDDGSEA